MSFLPRPPAILQDPPLLCMSTQLVRPNYSRVRRLPEGAKIIPRNVERLWDFHNHTPIPQPRHIHSRLSHTGCEPDSNVHELAHPQRLNLRLHLQKQVAHPIRLNIRFKADFAMPRYYSSLSLSLSLSLSSLSLTSHSPMLCSLLMLPGHLASLRGSPPLFSYQPCIFDS